MEVLWVKLNGALELVVDFDGEAERRERPRVSGFESVGAGEPHVIFAIIWRVTHGQFALVDCGVGFFLGVVDAAEELMRLGVAWLSGKEILKLGCGFVHAALLEQSVGLSFVGGEKRSCEEKDEQKCKERAQRG